MQIKCSKQDLLTALQTVFPAIANKTSLPILNNVLLKVTNENQLAITTTDMEISIKTEINVEVIKSGAITIPAKKLLDITKELGTNEIEISVKDDAKVNIKSGKSKFSIMGLLAEDFPIIPDFDKTDGFFIVNKTILKDMINKTIFAVSYDETRYVLNGLLLKIEDNKIIMVSTDGRRLCYIDNKFENQTVDNLSIILPTKTINELSKLIGMISNEEIQIGLRENQVAFKMDKNVMISKIIDGNFPNYNQVIPKEFSINIDVNRNELFNVTKRVALLTIDKNHSIKYSFWNDKLVVSATTQGVGEAEDEIAIKYDSNVFDIAYNPTYIMDVLRNMDSDEVVFKLSTPVNPCVIQEKNSNSSYLCVVMPMRL